MAIVKGTLIYPDGKKEHKEFDPSKEILNIQDGYTFIVDEYPSGKQIFQPTDTAMNWWGVPRED